MLDNLNWNDPQMISSTELTKKMGESTLRRMSPTAEGRQLPEELQKLHATWTAVAKTASQLSSNLKSAEGLQYPGSITDRKNRGSETLQHLLPWPCSSQHWWPENPACSKHSEPQQPDSHPVTLLKAHSQKLPFSCSLEMLPQC